MSLDIGHILSDWPYESSQVMARRIRGDDGRDKIQLRLDLGILQMECTGRPDGQRPHGYESLLEYYEHQFRRAKERAEGFELDEAACEELRHETNMYYHRYLAEFVLEEFEAVEGDTLRNLRVFDFCSAHAREEADRNAMEQYRPYVLMMHTRARARAALRDNRPRPALAAVRKGIRNIEEYYRQSSQEALLGSSTELAILRSMVKEIQAAMPIDPVERLRQQLAKAVQEERYEDAAKLRDLLSRSKPSQEDLEEQ